MQKPHEKLGEEAAQAQATSPEMDGWLVFPMGGVCAAADHAFREEGVGREGQWKRLLDGLDGKVITSAGHLSAQNVSFAEEISEVNGLLNFYL